MRGGDGVDVLTGSASDDRLYDRYGDAAERKGFNCGPGNDTVRADSSDRVYNSCENVNRGLGRRVTGRFLESEESNNFTCVDLDIQRDTVSVLRFDPGAPEVG